MVEITKIVKKYYCPSPAEPNLDWSKFSINLGTNQSGFETTWRRPRIFFTVAQGQPIESLPLIQVPNYKIHSS